MKTLEIILKGGLKSCCSTYSAEDLKVFTKTWFDETPDVKFDIIDIANDFYDTGELADSAYKYFGNAIFPLVYFNHQLVSIGYFPEKNECFKFMEQPVPVTAEDIEEAARMSRNQTRE
ncbi:MAG: hypothetical protein ACPLXM_00730 [Bacteroidales bacterium]